MARGLEGAGCAVLVVWLAWAAAARGEEPAFDWIEVPSPGRNVAAELADTDGDALADLLVIAFQGVPPREQRSIRVHRQRPGGGFPAQPDLVHELPADAAAYDVADVDPARGLELVLLEPAGLRVLSLAADPIVERELRIPEAPTLGAAGDERGLDRLRIAWTDFGPRMLLLVPRYGELDILTTSGELRSRLRVGGRANYLIAPRPGPLISESEVEVFFDAPQISAGDVDGDGRADLLASTRHDIRIFLQRPDGSFGPEPDRTLYPGRISEQELVRGTGVVRVAAADLDGDRRLDLVLSEAIGGFTSAVAKTTVHRNRAGSFDLARPDQRLAEQQGWGTDGLIDLDADGLPDLVRIRMPFSVLELVEILVTGAVDLELRMHRARPGGVFDPKPWAERKLDLALSFETFRLEGFPPTLEADLNRDGHPDLVASAGGTALEVYLGGPTHRFQSRSSRQRADTRGLLRPGDLEGDGFLDLVLFEPSLSDVPVRIARNLGRLAGSPPRLTPAAPVR